MVILIDNSSTVLYNLSVKYWFACLYFTPTAGSCAGPLFFFEEKNDSLAEMVRQERSMQHSMLSYSAPLAGTQPLDQKADAVMHRLLQARRYSQIKTQAYPGTRGKPRRAYSDYLTACPPGLTRLWSGFLVFLISDHTGLLSCGPEYPFSPKWTTRSCLTVVQILRFLQCGPQIRTGCGPHFHYFLIWTTNLLMIMVRIFSFSDFGPHESARLWSEISVFPKVDHRSCLTVVQILRFLQCGPQAPT